MQKLLDISWSVDGDLTNLWYSISTRSRDGAQSKITYRQTTQDLMTITFLADLKMSISVQWKLPRPPPSKNACLGYITVLNWLRAVWEFNLRQFLSHCPRIFRSARSLCCYDLEWRQLVVWDAHLSPEALIWSTKTLLTVAISSWVCDEFDPPVKQKCLQVVVVWD